MMLVNTKSALYGMQTVLPHFKDRKRGHVLNISSNLGRVPIVWFPAMYSASKHALNALTAMFRMELGASFPDIHFSTVSPGQISTPFGANAKHVRTLPPPSLLEQMRRPNPNAQSPDEVATVIADVLDRPRADEYTRPGMREMVAAYYAAEDMAAVEQAPPFTPSAAHAVAARRTLLPLTSTANGLNGVALLRPTNATSRLRTLTAISGGFRAYSAHHRWSYRYWL